MSTIAFDIQPPTPAMWFYLSALLAVALFVKFARLLSVRNLDVLTLFLPMPGLLLLLEGDRGTFWGYLWLLGACGYFLVRCLFDLTLVRRPALTPNLSLGGLLWLAAGLFVGLAALAARQPNEPADSSRPEMPLDRMRGPVENLIRQGAPVAVDHSNLHLWLERGVAVCCHLSIALALVLIGWRHFDDLHAGAAAAAFYLLLPYPYLLMPATALGGGRWDHAWPMALMIWMVLAYCRPTVAGLLLGLAAGTTLFPALVLPVWLGFYWGRGARRFALAFLLAAGLCLTVLGVILWVNGELPRSLPSGWVLSAWAPWQQPGPQVRGLWQGLPAHWAYRLPVFVAYVALLVTTAFWPSPKDLARVIALTAALLIGLQFWYADQGGIYVLWYLPFLLLLVFRPNLSACQPPPPCDDWLARQGRKLRWTFRRLLRLAIPRVRRPPRVPQSLV
jgi:hypothetical protein